MKIHSMLSYADLLHKLFSMPKRGMRTFESFQKLDQKFECPHQSFRTIHVGGTNGKGSVATKIARGLQEEGFRVGLYISPHIATFRERIQVNDTMISEEDVRELLTLVFSKLEEPLSFFDVTTAIAFLYFQKQRVDWAVLEV
ncbi:MAG: bifunctional folylpolyglutamate synthase/dihydrofolate synthase, partial [Chlamydiae bacterium]|nr:bifunctional folylpolyglutamate synthase/dihydrofolate synthase [Chlamydiota bacterium]